MVTIYQNTYGFKKVTFHLFTHFFLCIHKLVTVYVWGLKNNLQELSPSSMYVDSGIQQW